MLVYVAQKLDYFKFVKQSEIVDFLSDLRSKVMFKHLKKSTHEEEGVKRVARLKNIVISTVVGKYKKNIEMTET